MSKGITIAIQFVILGALMEGKNYGYEIKKLIEQRLGGFSGVKFGSIYFALDRMVKRGWVRKVREEKVAGRPARLLYRITKKGKEKFYEIAEDVFLPVRPVFIPVDLALSFADALGKSRLEELFKRRLDDLQAKLSTLRRLRKLHEDKGLREELSVPIIEHGIEHLKVEIRWTKSMLNRLGGGELLKEGR